MLDNIKVDLYGTRTAVVTKPKNKSTKVRARAPTPKKYVRISNSDIKNAKAFHIFYRKSPRSAWIRLTDDLAVFPSGTRSKKEKEILIDLYAEYLIGEKFPKRKPRPKPKPKPKPKPRPKPKPKPEPEPEPIPTPILVELPDLPVAPRVTPTKKEVVPKLRLILMDELFGKGYEWPDERVENMLDKLWRGFAAHPHLLSSDEFRRHIVIKEIVEQTKKERLAEGATLQGKFREELMGKEISLDPKDVGGSVKVQIKEVFNKLDMETPEDQEREMRTKDGDIVVVDRQILFAQVVTEYDEFIQVNKDDILSNQEMFMEAIEKVKRDVLSIFNESLEKGVFSFGPSPQYSIRLITPMIDTKGEVPTTYLDRDGNTTSGYGFSTGRREINNEDDLDDMIDELFGDLPRILAKYVMLNNAEGMGFTGFVIERILR